jgi:hypothetical protein
MPQVDARGGPEALAKYTELLATAITSGGDDRSKRFLEYKIAQWTARLADGKTGDEFRKAAVTAIDKLTAVVRASAKSWELWPAAATAARLQSELGKFNDAAAIYGLVAKVEGVPPALRNEAKLREAEALFRSGSGIGGNGRGCVGLFGIAGAFAAGGQKGTGEKDGGKKRSHQFSGIVFHGISFGDFHSNIFYIIQEQKFFVNKKEPAIFSNRQVPSLICGKLIPVKNASAWYSGWCGGCWRSSAGERTVFRRG